MIEQGQKSIDFEYKILGRVLSNYEHEDDEDEEEDDDDEDTKEDEGNKYYIKPYLLFISYLYQ